LYPRSVRDLYRNLLLVAESLQRNGQEFEWTTVSEAAACWRTHQQCVIA